MVVPLLSAVAFEDTPDKVAFATVSLYTTKSGKSVASPRRAGQHLGLTLSTVATFPNDVSLIVIEPIDHDPGADGGQDEDKWRDEEDEAREHVAVV